MKTMSKVAIALVGAAGLALAAESAQAQLVLNGAGSSAGRLFAGSSPAAICAATPTPLLFVSSEGTPNMYEWQCTVNGVANSRIRYSASASADGYLKQPNGAIGTATFLNVATCPAGTPVTILGKTVNRSVCPAATPTQVLTVHWGASDVQASALNQTANGVTLTPPAAGHLTSTPTVIVPFSIVVGGNVRNGAGTSNLVSLTSGEIRQLLHGNVINWTDMGYNSTAVDKGVVVCNRTIGSGSLATVSETLFYPKYYAGFPPTQAAAGGPPPTMVYNASSSNMVNCLNNNGNSIGYVDSDSVTATNFPNGAYQVQVDGQPVNSGALGTGVARLTALRCGRYPVWADWVFAKRSAGVQGAPINAVAGTNTAIDNLETAMFDNNPLPDFWLSEKDTFVFKQVDRGPMSWFTPSLNNTAISTVCQ